MNWLAAHWSYLLLAWVGVSWVILKSPARANSIGEAVFNAVNPILLPLIVKIPVLGPIAAALLGVLDTRAPVPAIAPLGNGRK